MVDSVELLFLGDFVFIMLFYGEYGNIGFGVKIEVRVNWLIVIIDFVVVIKF